MSIKIKNLNLINLFKSNNGSAVFLAVIILSGMLAATLVMANIIVSGVKMGKTQFDSTKAYFAAEAGVERLLWEVRQSPNLFEPETVGSGCTAGTSYVNFDNVNNPPNAAICGAIQSNSLNNNSSYYVFFKSQDAGASSMVFKSFGVFNDTRRSIEVTYYY